MMDPSQAKIHANAGGTRPAKRAQSQRARNGLILLSLGVAAVAALAGFSARLLSDRSASATAAAPESFSTGTIAESDTPVCRRLTFDNNGQIVRDVVPCDGSVRDARGQPVPVGTVQRLDAISKAFSGR